LGKTVAIVLAGGEGKRLSILTRYRAKPAVPFAGRFRIIDFTLSNCVHSNIDEVYILTQYISHSLIRHLGRGEAWDLDRRKGGLHILHPHLGARGADWYRGTADALYQNLSVLENVECDRFLILSGDHIYMVNYNDFISSHLSSGKPASVAVVEVPRYLRSEFGIATVNSKNEIVKFEEKPERSESSLASMGIYLFEKRFMLSLLEKLEGRFENLDFGKHVIPYLVERKKVAAYRFNGYWLDIGTVKSYYNASMGLLKKIPRLELFGGRWNILTKSEDRPPLYISRSAELSKTLVSDGCRIEGAVHSSVLSPGVIVEKGARVENSIVFHDCIIAGGAVVKNSILDKEVRVGKGAVVGGEEVGICNELQPEYINFGISIIGKRTRIWRRMKIGSNCVVAGSPYSGYIPKGNVEDGKSLIVD